jgi:thioesterase domain-containing protein
MNIAATREYRPRVYDGRVTLFRAADNPVQNPDSDLGWSEFAARGVDLHIVPGNHYTILREPNVMALAERLLVCRIGVADRGLY